MNNVQQGMLDLLKEIDDICSRNNITYYLGGGTALGAVRHRGFLPWDDDADLYITRDNWEKLLAVIDNELAPNRELVCVERFPDYCNPIARYMNLDSTWIYQSQMFSGVPAGQHIEFLILDPMPADPAEHDGYIKLFQVYAELIGSYFVVNRVISQNTRFFDDALYKKWLAHMDSNGREATLAELEKKLFCYPDTECSVYHLRHGFEYHIYTKKNFGRQRYVPYETTKLPVAEHAEAVFREAYGDSWKKVPLPDEQVVHKSTSSLSVPYTEYWKRAFSRINRKQVLDLQLRWKRSAVDLIQTKNAASRDKLIMKAHMNIHLAEYLYGSASNSATLSDFDRYYDLQAESTARTEGLIAKVDTSFISSAMTAWLSDGLYWKAHKLIKLFRSQGAFSDICNFFEPICEDSRMIDASMDIAEFDQAASIAESATPEARNVSPLYAHADLAQLVSKRGFEDKGVSARAKELTGEFPDYTYFSYVYARSIEQQDIDTAAHIYQRIVTDTQDGLLIIDAEDRLQALEGKSAQ